MTDKENHIIALLKKARRATLKHEEKDRVREQLLETVRNEGSIRHHGYAQGATPSPYRSFLYKPINHKTSMYTIAITVIAALGAGTSYAAEGATPGDALYPVKTGVNEEVRGWFAFGAESEAEWESRRAIRRLEEAEQLSAEGGLSAQARAQLEDRFEAHTENVNERIARLKEEGNMQAAANVSSDFESSIEAHERILTRISQDTNGEVNALLDNVRASAEAAARTRNEVEADIASDTSAQAQTEIKAAAEGKATAAKNKIAEVKAFFDERTDASADAQARLTAAEEAHTEGQAALEAENYNTAFVRFQEALRTAQQAKVMVQSSIRLDLNLGGGARAEGEAGSESGEARGGGGTQEDDRATSSERGTRIRTETEVQGGANAGTEDGSTSGSVDAEAETETEVNTSI